MQNQRGFIGLPVLILIVLGLIVVGGGAYYVMMHQRSSSPTLSDNNLDNSQTLPTTNTQPNTQATNNTPSVGSPFAASPASGTAGHPVIFSSSLGGKTGTGYFIDWGDNAEVWYTCGQNIPILNISGGEAENCLPATVQHTYVGANSYTATLNKITGISADGHYTSTVVGTATVAITGTNTLPSPTCTLTASPSTATVGQKITISWTTQNANAGGPSGYGAWVGLGGGDSILTQMITLTSLSGTQTVTAQKVGSEKLGLEINGPGGNGEGSCSVQITTASGASSLQTYTNSQYGLSIQYPSTLTQAGYVSDPSWYDNHLQPTGSTLFSGGLSFPPDAGNGAVVGGVFNIRVSSNSADTASCLTAPPSSETTTSHIGTTAINGVSFLSYERDDAFAGGSNTTNHYRTLHNGSCFDMYATITYAGGAAGAQTAAANQAQLQTTFNAMVQSFRFTQ